MVVKREEILSFQLFYIYLGEGEIIMKKLKRFLMVITLMFCFSFGLASCISNDPNSNTGQTENGKTEPTVTAPTAKTLVYNGDAQVLINAGTTTGGKMLYKLAGGKYSEELPSVMAAGTYKVYYGRQKHG